MSTTTPMAVRIGRSAVRTALSAILATLAFAAVLVGSVAAPTSWSARANAADDSCPSVEVVFARGTSEAAGVGATGQAFVDALNARLPGKAIEVYGVDYPASLDFGQAADGIVDAANEIETVAASCPNTKIVLGGYSQGAAVAGYTTTDTIPTGFELPAGVTGPMPPAIAAHVAAVVLFGTPDSWFLSLADHNAPPITIGRMYTAKTLQLCATGDPVCFPGGLDRSAHSSYKNNGMAEQAADFATSQLITPTQAATVQQTAGEASVLNPPMGN
jgi:cutinase